MKECEGGCKYPFRCMQVDSCMKSTMESEDKPPTNWEELCKRQARNYEITGQGMDTTNHLPCVFCGAPDFMVFKILESHRMAEGAVCKECGRGCRMPVHPITHENGTIVGKEIRMEQTIGADPEPWFLIQIPRVKTN